MTYYEIAQQIPPQFRADILLGNFIWKALANESDPDMIKLFIFYKNYIEPDNLQYQYENGRIVNACKMCLTKILDTFKLLEPYLIILEKESKLIEDDNAN